MDGAMLHSRYTSIAEFNGELARWSEPLRLDKECPWIDSGGIERIPKEICNGSP
jgi:hypothetical protein